ncbi:MAG: 1-deoxy-D-xylulose-5-phosphate synthase [Deltaproteobacteria bacterium]|nr:1-deoxy-D-xylulose-5-phosphate synthase [Deltaproteobacteria bacterium]MBT4086932.1 1-deoxy-D-xylulose-5-phosphate synthase [Deltaproteobacteria bacterium]MBT4266347.1 1-deoxy-D-xylulose-5-phosphate synthase [Deltaproteobacteria bacterium]MBT4643969.1 1-deoxy-D-xylulose-5-phosphate synthase [Deltaproteobacteria bacterium]MBT6502571.1 1-deoxy-D-xylulose-5-phosphate synthase [Deltaproteobacteria bacterium]
MLNELKKCNEIQCLSLKKLEELAGDCRKQILEVVSQTGGHLASSLGAVELTVALAKVFDLERDKVVWDVGHQTYAYKLLTGRSDRFNQIGKKGGLSKFLSRFESKYDHFGAGHASTSISASLGISKARTLNGDDFKTIAVIGDGAMTGGLAYEALNHTGHLDENLIVILNDNEMSIDVNVGALSRTVLNISSSKSFNRVRAEIIRQIREHKLPLAITKTMDRVNDSLMAFFTKGIWFEKFNFRYFGQADGHSIKDLVSFLKLIKDIRGPILLHVITQKGKGFQPAEMNPAQFHGVGPFDLVSGKPQKRVQKGKSYTSIWSRSFAQIMDADEKVVGVSAAMSANTGLAEIQKSHPDRIFDVGIAEGHAVTFAGGMSTEGIKPFVVIYSTFLQRAFDHITHDICRQSLPVRFILDRGGFVGADGATHHGILDLTYLRMIPNMVVMVPKDGTEMQAMINLAYKYNDGPIAMRFPRGSTTEYSELLQSELPELSFGKGEKLQTGADILLLAVGTMVESALEVAKILEATGLSVGVINARFVKPLDQELILSMVSSVKLIATMEENVRTGGFGSGILELLAEHEILKPVVQFGVPDQFIKFASREEQIEEAGLDVPSMTAKLQRVWKKMTGPTKNQVAV